MKRIIIKATNERGEYQKQHPHDKKRHIIFMDGGYYAILKDDEFMSLKWWSFVYYPKPKMLEILKLTPDEWHFFTTGVICTTDVFLILLIIKKLIELW